MWNELEGIRRLFSFIYSVVVITIIIVVVVAAAVVGLGRAHNLFSVFFVPNYICKPKQDKDFNW